MSNHILTTLVVEPNYKLHSPYHYLAPNRFQLKFCRSIQQALTHLDTTPPDLVLISTSFSTSQLLTFLTQLKNTCYTYRLMPLIFIVDLNQPLSHIPGTKWGGKIGILHPLVSKLELDSTLKRLL